LKSPPPAPPPLARYRQKRNFQVTSEPEGASAKGGAAGAARPLSFVVQKHWASRLHYDFRLEHDGVLLSWAVPKGPSFDPAKKQMAIHVEDHPLDYASFEGTIPPRQYGAGTVIVWDRGTWQPEGDPREGMAAGKLVFRLHGEKLAGLWELVRIAKPGDRQDAWMLFKKKDAWARPVAEYDVITALPDSVVARPLGLVEEREPRGAPPLAAATNRVATTASDMAAAARAPLPAKIEPQLATLVATPPSGDWIVETKFDGYRLMTRIDKGKAKLVTRGGHDWTEKMKPLAAAIEALGIASAWLDGEIVVMNRDGLPDFNALQNAIDNAASEAIEYFVFDLPFHDGKDLRKVPLRARRSLLAELLEKAPSDRVRLSQAFPATPAQMLEAARSMQLEGIIIKRPDAPYVSQRSETWLKLKCALRQEFVICGFNDRNGAHGEVGSLFLGTWENGVLTYAGNVGTGWSSRTARDLHARLAAIETATPTLAIDAITPGRWSRRSAGGERWVRPELVAEVSFREWTPEGHVRHAVFVAPRLDKPAREVTREVAASGSASGAPPAVPTTTTTSIKVSNPDRVIDPSTGITKVMLVRYYESIAERIVPHLRDRPVSLVRAPEGITGELFFQKHAETRIPGVREVDPKLWPGHAAMIAIDSVEGLVSAAQMNTIEFHTVNSTIDHIDRPDRVIFDLDPGEGVAWPQIQEAALLMRAMLKELGLASWLKTSGGKGLHIVVPLAPELAYDVVKGFAQAIVTHLAKTIPERFVAKSGGGNRVGRIFIDYLRNGARQTTAAAFSARSRPGLGVSMPVAWDQLMTLKGGAQWTITTAREYLSFEQRDPWADYRTCTQTIAEGMRILGYKASGRRNAAG